MAGYKIFETNTFLKELSKMASPFEQGLIRRKLDNQIYPRIRFEPHFGNHIKKLKEYHPETWRYRISHFRLFYSIDEGKKVVVVTSFRLRKDAYR